MKVDPLTASGGLIPLLQGGMQGAGRFAVVGGLGPARLKSTVRPAAIALARGKRRRLPVLLRDGDFLFPFIGIPPSEAFWGLRKASLVGASANRKETPCSKYPVHSPPRARSASSTACCTVSSTSWPKTLLRLPTANAAMPASRRAAQSLPTLRGERCAIYFWKNFQRSRLASRQAAVLTFIQEGLEPGRYVSDLRFETMPS